MRPESTILTTLIAGALLSLLLLPVMEQHAAPAATESACPCSYASTHADAPGLSRARPHDGEASAEVQCRFHPPQDTDHDVSP